MLFFLKNDRIVIREKQVFVRDTVIIHDTVYQTRNEVGPVQGEKRMNIKAPASEKPNDNPYRDADLTFKIIPSENSTYGYDILLNGRVMIHQPSIPGLPGNEGFRTKETAKKIAGLVIGKIRKNEMPPSVTMREMKELETLK